MWGRFGVDVGSMWGRCKIDYYLRRRTLSNPGPLWPFRGKTVKMRRWRRKNNRNEEEGEKEEEEEEEEEEGK